MSNPILTTSIKHPNEFSIITGKTNLVEDLSSIEQSIRLLLTTSKGELFGDPNFGSNLYSYLYEYQGEVLYQLIKDDIVETLTNQDTRVDVDSSNIEIEEDGSTLHIKIRYNIRYTDYSNEFTLLVSKRSEEDS